MAPITGMSAVRFHSRFAVSVAPAAVGSKRRMLSRLTVLFRLLRSAALLQDVWGPQYGEETNYLRVHMAHIRRKLSNRCRVNRVISTPSPGSDIDSRTTSPIGLTASVLPGSGLTPQCCWVGLTPQCCWVGLTPQCCWVGLTPQCCWVGLTASEIPWPWAATTDENGVGRSCHAPACAGVAWPSRCSHDERRRSRHLQKLARTERAKRACEGDSRQSLTASSSLSGGMVASASGGGRGSW